MSYPLYICHTKCRSFRVQLFRTTLLLLARQFCTYREREREREGGKKSCTRNGGLLFDTRPIFDMDFYDFFAFLISILLVGYLVRYAISLADARARIELQKRMQKMSPRTSADQRGPQQKTAPTIQDVAELGKWVYELGETFGFDPEMLFVEQIPPEVSRLLPLEIGFLDSGGLAKIQALAGGLKPAEPTQEMK